MGRKLEHLCLLFMTSMASQYARAIYFGHIIFAGVNTTDIIIFTILPSNYPTVVFVPLQRAILNLRKMVVGVKYS